MASEINERLKEIDNLLYPDRPYPVDDEVNLGVLMEERRVLRASINLCEGVRLIPRPRPAGWRAQSKG